ncbi:MAG: SDR family oxidoreductase [Parvicellaceae bacterium]
MIRYLITGATGILGTNFICEIIKQNINSLENVEIHIIGRNKNSISLENRLKLSLEKNGQYYIFGKEVSDSILSKILKRFHFINHELSNEKFNKDVLKKLSKINFHHFFHIAALTDLRNNEKSAKNLNLINVIGTQNILKSLKDVDINQFHFVSSAYVCGNNFGDILDDYITDKPSFRNHYEKSKLKSETIFTNYCKTNNKSFKVYRPSIISGRTIEKPLGFTNKFDVFYSWANFWFKLRLNSGLGDNDFTKPFSVPVRICLNSNSGLNIISCDLAAKMIYQISESDTAQSYFNIVNDENLNHIDHVTYMLKKLNIIDYSFTESIPQSFNNNYEALYYKIIGDVFTPYMSQDVISFKKLYESNLKSGSKNQTLDLNDFKMLIDFAVKSKFISVQEY